MKRALIQFVFGILTLLLTLSATAVETSGTAAAFDQANALYEQGRFAEAAAAYEKLLQSGAASAAVYFNLGNAWFKSGQLGQAIAAYRKAREMTPRDPDVRANLQFARNQSKGPTAPASRWQRWLGALSVNEWTLLSAGALWLLLLLLTAGQLRPAWKLALRGWVVTIGLATAILCAGLGAALFMRHSLQTAIVVMRDVPVHNGPHEMSANAFTAHDGAELRILDERDDWLRVTDGSRRNGWVRREQVLVAPGT